MPKLHSNLFIEAQKTHASKNLAVQILTFILFIFIVQLAQGLVCAIFTMPSIAEEMSRSGMLESGGSVSFTESYQASMKAIESTPSAMIAMLYTNIFGILFAIAYCRAFEHRSYASMGFRKRKAVPRYLTGLLAGIILMSLITGLAVLTETADLSLAADINIGMIIVYFFGFLIQGASEEIMFRGYFMTTIGGTHSPVTAVAVSSLAFAAAHLGNGGISVLAFINLTLFGAFAAFYMICFDDIWGVCAVHSIWNFTQGNIFGISVSGMSEAASVFRFNVLSDKNWLSGGDFGIEGSIITTAILTAAIVLILLRIRKNQSAETQDASGCGIG